MLARILVAYDDGNVAQKALDKAIDLARGSLATIYLISVYNENSIRFWARQGYKYPQDADKLFSLSNEELAILEAKYIEYIMSGPANKVREAGIKLQCVVMGGKPGEVIKEYAEDIDADLVVMGTHNRGPAARFILGSVANELIHRAPCPVMVVRE